MNFFETFPEVKVIQEISKRKKIPIFLVGGFLRDFCLGRKCFDLDFAVQKEALKISKVFAKKIKGAYVLLDEEHGCARVVKRSNNQIRTFDFADFRAKTLTGDLTHRDFTINALAVDIKDISASPDLLKALKDPKNGLRDLKVKTIRMTQPKVFKEDPLRLLRAFSLNAVLDFKIEPKTLSQIKKDKSLIREASYERIRDEFFKILESPNAASVIKAIDKAGLLERFMPQITVMYNVVQGGYHHLDVWPHSLETVLQLEKLIESLHNNQDITDYLKEPLAGTRTRLGILKLAALLHDIGKPQTKKIEKGRMSFHAHERVGKGIVRSLSKMMKLSTHERHILEDIVLWHLRPGYLSNFKVPSERSVFRFFRDTQKEAASILLLSLADQRATRGPLTTEADQKHHENICLSLIEKYFIQAKQTPFVRLIDGNDLIKTLKLKPSPLFSKILTTIEEKQSLGEIVTKKEALEVAKEIVNKN